MNLITSTNIKTLVRSVYIIVIALTLAYATAYAEQAIQFPLESGCKTQECYDNSRLQDRCNAKAIDLKKNMEQMGRVCSLDSGSLSPGSNNTKCAQKYKDCLKAPTTVAGADSVLAQLLGTPAPEIRRNCDLKPTSYFQRRKEYTDKIESLGKEIRALEKDDNQIDKDYQKEVKDLQEEFAKEQKSLDTLQEEISNKNMEEEKAALEEDQKAAKNLSQLLQSKMQLRNDLSSATVKAQASLLQASDELSRGKCIAQVKKFKADNATGLKSKSAGDLIGGANTLQKQLQAQFEACMQIMNIQRQEIGRELSEKVSEISFKMDETDRQIQQLEDYNKQSSQQRAQRTQLMADKKEKAIKASAVKVQQLQAQLVQAGENAKTQHASTKKALLDVTQAKNKANAQLLALGAEDKDSSSTSEKSTMEDIQTYNTYVVNFDDFSKGECCNPTSKNDLCSTAKTIGESGKVNVNGSK